MGDLYPLLDFFPLEVKQMAEYQVLWIMYMRFRFCVYSERLFVWMLS